MTAQTPPISADNNSGHGAGNGGAMLLMKCMAQYPTTNPLPKLGTSTLLGSRKYAIRP